MILCVCVEQCGCLGAVVSDYSGVGLHPYHPAFDYHHKGTRRGKYSVSVSCMIFLDDRVVYVSSSLLSNGVDRASRGRGDSILEDEGDHAPSGHFSSFSFRSLQTHHTDNATTSSPSAGQDATGKIGGGRGVLNGGPRNYRTMGIAANTQQPIPQSSGWWNGIRNIFAFGSVDETERSVPVVAYTDDETTR